MKANILGTEYTILDRSTAEDVLLQTRDGYMDKTTKTIVISTKDDDCDLGDFEEYRKSVIRHEITHAFFYESGLSACVENKPYGISETIIDWFAIQSPKIYEVFKQLDIL